MGHLFVERCHKASQSLSFYIAYWRNMELKNKAVLITGGARIGQAVAELLARRGCHIAMTYRSSRGSAEETVKKAASLGVKSLTLQADFQKAGDIEKLVPAVEKAFGRLDILVNMASIYEKTPLPPLMDKHGPESLVSIVKPWQENLDINLRSAYWLALRSAPVMRKNGGGRIINFTDWVAVSDRPRYKEYLPYYVSKVGVKGLTESLALELAPDILVNAVAPGPIIPPPDLPETENQEVIKNTPLKKWGGAVEIAKAVAFLAETDFVTGECLRVDGGRHLY
jgi:NAD(P)-dependent dehydrogenase (short-subunit alcohol dehydrogenase family)